MFRWDGERGFETNSGGHVERKRTSSFLSWFTLWCLLNFKHVCWLCFARMTVGLRDGIGVDSPNNSGRKLEGCDEEESGDQGSEERSTKRDEVEILNPSTTGCSSSAPVITTSVSNPSGPCSSQQPRSSTAPSHDQHHFLRSSVRPPSKRIRKDSIAPTINGHSGAKSKGMPWKCLCLGVTCVCVTGVPHPSTPRW